MSTPYNDRDSRSQGEDRDSRARGADDRFFLHGRRLSCSAGCWSHHCRSDRGATNLRGMTILAVITAHCRDLATICLASLQRHAPEINRLIVTTDPSCQGLAECFSPSMEVPLKAPPGGAANHAAALELARRTIPIIAPPDVVLCLDDDVVLLSSDVLLRLARAFDDSGVWMWGAEGIRDPL